MTGRKAGVTQGEGTETAAAVMMAEGRAPPDTGRVAAQKVLIDRRARARKLVRIVGRGRDHHHRQVLAPDRDLHRHHHLALGHNLHLDQRKKLLSLC